MFLTPIPLPTTFILTQISLVFFTVKSSTFAFLYPSADINYILYIQKIFFFLLIQNNISLLYIHKKKINLYYLHKVANNFIYTQKINFYCLHEAINSF